MNTVWFAATRTDGGPVNEAERIAALSDAELNARWNAGRSADVSAVRCVTVYADPITFDLR